MVAQVRTDETCLYGKAAELRRVPLFADLDDETLAGVAAVSHRTRACARRLAGGGV